MTSKQVTSPSWNGRRLVHSKEMIWASRWSIALRTFYRQILSVLYSSFPFGNFRPRLVRALLVWYTVVTIHVETSQVTLHSLQHFLLRCAILRLGRSIGHFGCNAAVLHTGPVSLTELFADGCRSTDSEDANWIDHSCSFHICMYCKVLHW